MCQLGTHPRLAMSVAAQSREQSHQMNSVSSVTPFFVAGMTCLCGLM